ncbi:MAG: hypothetical protein WDZ76_14560 [Pseudohongiellaceae bacterium]
MRRWQTGHHAFFVLIQGIVINQRQLLARLRQGNISASRAAFKRATRLLDASAAAMRLTGRMPASCYDAVRESMTPPSVPAGFSGLWSIDHRAMIDELKALKRQIVVLDDDLIEDHQSWMAALDRAYQSHAYVCEQFVGDGPSLAMRTEKNTSQRSGLQSLDAFRERTLNLAAMRGSKQKATPSCEE